jgi:hypothetical protein
MGIGVMAPDILNLVTKCKLVVTFTLRPLYSHQGNSPLYILYRILGELQRWFMVTVTKEELRAPPGIRNPIVQFVASHCTD